MKNLVVLTMLEHKSIRKYTDEMPSDDIIKTIVGIGHHTHVNYQFCDYELVI